MEHRDSAVCGTFSSLLMAALCSCCMCWQADQGNSRQIQCCPSLMLVLEVRCSREERTCAGAVLASSSWLARLCFCCMVRQKICCMPLDTTEMAAMTVPRTLFPISRSVMVLHRRQESFPSHPGHCQPSAVLVVRKTETGHGHSAWCTKFISRSVMVLQTAASSAWWPPDTQLCPTQFMRSTSAMTYNKPMAVLMLRCQQSPTHVSLQRG